MAALIRHRLTEGILSLGSVGALLVGMSFVDDTFREHLAGVLTGGPSSALALAGVRMQRVARIAMETAGEGKEHMALVLFSLAALALLLLMLRT